MRKTLINEQEQRLKDWLKKIESYHPNEIELGLERVQKIASSMDLLSPNAKVIIVGGTNGKGSCVAMLESLAINSDITVGSYTSPHLLEFNERIRINGRNVSDIALIDAFDEIEKYRQDTALTFFEFTTLAALYVFSKIKLDLIVLEIGLGGRLDAVNIVDRDISIITTIDIDHTDWLGDSLQEIAIEKSGIYRDTSLNLVGDQISADLLQKSNDLKSKSIQLVEKNLLIKCYGNNYSKLIQDSKTNQFNLLKQNVELALTSFQHLFKKHSQTIDFKHCLSSIKISGRFQQVNNEPLVILDVAHNTQAAKNLVKQISTTSCNGKRVAICGLMSDKAIKEYLSVLGEVIDEWFFIGLPIDRAAKPDDLLMLFKKLASNTTLKSSQNIRQALDILTNTLNVNDQVYILGYFITVSEFLKQNFNCHTLLMNS